MPSFAWHNSFREGQWRVFREFVTQERRDVNSRSRVILAEQNRIGRAFVLYKLDESTGLPTEKRAGFQIEGGPNCAIGKLVSAYVALGGNPFDISMFLRPDQGVIGEDGQYFDPYQPGSGVAYKLGFSYSFDSATNNADANLSGYKPSRIGGEREVGEERLSTPIKLLRNWNTKEMYQKRILIEERILKLSDLYEQLEQERQDLIRANRGVDIRGVYDTNLFSDKHTIQFLVFLFDSTWRVKDEDNGVNPEGQVNTVELGSYPNLMSDEDSDSFHTL